MQFSVEVKRLKEGTLYICRGHLQQGNSSEYLFNLLTRPDQKDVIIDVAELNVERSGLPVLALCSKFVFASHRRFLLQHAPDGLVQDLRACHGVILSEQTPAQPAAVAAKAVNSAAS
jgi:hypothetical protein